MGHAAPLDWRDLVRANVETTIDRRRVAAHDLAIETEGKPDPQGALAGGGRSENSDEEGRPRHDAVSARNRASAASAASTISRPICCDRVGHVIGRSAASR